MNYYDIKARIYRESQKYLRKQKNIKKNEKKLWKIKN